MSEFYEQAKERLQKESKEKMSMHGEAMKAAVMEALLDFCRQEEEFAQAVVQGGSFKDCMAAVCKKIKGQSISALEAISDLEAYKAAVEFYFPGAAVSMKMNIDLCGDASGEAAPTPEPGKGMIIDLSAFF